MKVTGIILIILGGLMIAFNVIGILGDNSPTPVLDGGNLIAYYIGYYLFIIVGAILLVIGYHLRRKARIKKTKKGLLENFLSDNQENRGS